MEHNTNTEQTQINAEDVNVLTATVSKISPRYVSETFEEAKARVPELSELGAMTPTGDVLAKVCELVDTKVGMELFQIFENYSSPCIFLFREVGKRPYSGQQQ